MIRLIVVGALSCFFMFIGPHAARAGVFEVNEDMCPAPGEEAIIYQAEAGPTLATCDPLFLEDTARIRGVVELTPRSFTLKDAIQGPNGLISTLGDDMAFLIVTISVDNISDTNLTISPNNFFLINPQSGSFTTPSTLALQNDPRVSPGTMGLLSVVPPGGNIVYNVVLPCFKAWVKAREVQFGFLYTYDPLSQFRPKEPAVVWELFR